MATAYELSAVDVAKFRECARRHVGDERRALAARERHAWAQARRAAVVLRQLFHVDRLVVFGSLVHPGCFTAWSDVDVAAWGLRPADTLRAMGMAMDLDGDVAIHLVDVATCSAALRRVIQREGVPL